MRLWLVLALLVLFSEPSLAQVGGIRFEIARIEDTTFSFARGRARWVRPGMEGVVVDPRQRDVAVARFRVVGVSGEEVTAVVMGQITRLSQEHVAVLNEPRPRTWLAFLGGLGLGLVIGIVFAPH
jgi:hypothetical protein